jgi:hypothetical protein
MNFRCLPILIHRVPTFYEQEMSNHEHKTETEVKSDLVISWSWQHCIYMHQLADQWSTIYIWLPSRALPSFDKFFGCAFSFFFRDACDM